MTNHQVEVTVDNERSLKTLSRAIQFSEGQFSLVFARCNYRALLEQVLEQLRELCRGKIIRELVLPPTTQTLYTTIQANLGDQQPSALIVLGLESVVALDTLLVSTNQVRDEFRKQLPFTLILWVNDQVLKKLVRFAPDFSSWAATPIKFEVPTDQLLGWLSSRANSVFATILNIHADKLPHNTAVALLPGQQRLELEFALQDLQNRGVTLESELNASVQFIFGQDDYANDRIDSAISRYRESLIFWRNSNNLDRQGVLLFQLGLCHCRNADRFPAVSRRQLEEAWTYLQQCIGVFEEAGRQDNVAYFISQLEEVLQRLEAWPALEAVAKKSVPLHETYGSRLQLAIDYGILAKIALRQSRWEDANRHSTLALCVLSEANKCEHPNHGLYRLLLEQLYRLVLVKSQRCLGQMEAAASNLEKCTQELERVIQLSAHQFDPHRYLRTLRQVRSLYFDLGRYREAFRIQKEQSSVQQQYGFRAFIGAGQLQPELDAVNPALEIGKTDSNLEVKDSRLSGTMAEAIAASGRQQDVNRLLERISRPDFKLTVIHGQSGVGKSSLVAAGLVPTLKSNPLGDQIALPVVLRVYRDWAGVLSRHLTEALKEIKYVGSPDTLNSSEAILEQLHRNENRHLLTVLIFDQLEEFFLLDSQLEQRREFYEFFQKCLNLPSVKLILSIREDYLHHLLELEKFASLEKFNVSILDKTVRYPLGNFSPQDAKSVIENLTKRANFYLEDALIDELVKDLSDELGEVLPIELQVVGAQLQAENITTLQQYQQVGPKEKLVERYLEKVIQDCGSENQQTAQLVLYCLTDENSNRPLKTKAELTDDLAGVVEDLDLILEILVDSGLVFLIPEIPTNRYQLVHDYLVSFIRQKDQLGGLQAELEALRSRDEVHQTQIEQLRQEKALLAELADARYQIFQDYLEAFPTHYDKSSLLAELAEARQREELSYFVIEQLRNDKELLVQLAEAKENQKSSEQRRKKYLKALAASVALGFVFIVLAVSAIFERRQAEINAINVLSVSSEALFASHKDIDALTRSVKAGIKLQQVHWPNVETQTQVLTALQQAVYGVREHNRLEGHTAGVYSVAISPNGQLIASASADNTVKIWRPDGTLMPAMLRHEDRVSSVSFSPNGQLLASGSWDNTVKLWRRDGTLVSTLEGHSDIVLGVSFSPDGQRLASASADKTIKIWRLDGTLLTTLTGHQAAVQSVSFSPNGQLIATASADKTIKIWRLDGGTNPEKLPLRTLTGHTDGVTSVSFSPDGQIIASASADKTIKLWHIDGTLIRTLSGHTGLVNSVSFSPDGRTLASASFDNTIKLWQSDDGSFSDTETLSLLTLEGHSNWVSSVCFSPDGKTLISASRDKTIRLWSLDNPFVNTLKGHESAVNAVSFNPDGQTLASGGDDKTVRLWHLDSKTGRGVPLQTLLGHKGGVNSVRFSQDGQMLASAGADNTVNLWRINSKTNMVSLPPQTLIGHRKGVLGVSFSRDGQLIATASKDKTVRIWRRDGTLLHTLRDHSQPVNWVSFSPDSQIIASASDDKTVKLWSRDGILLSTLRGHDGAVWGVAFNPDGQTIASASLDNTVKLWSRDGKFLKTLKEHSDGITSVSFSPDGQLLASGSLDNTINLWSKDGKLLKTIKGQNAGVTNVSFSPDGQTIAAALTDGRIILWKLADLNLDSLLARGCDWLHDYLKHNVNVGQSNDRPFQLFGNPPSDRDLCNGIQP